jgi:AraC-like DNA-binding protein
MALEHRGGDAAQRPVLVRPQHPALVMMARGRGSVSCGSFRARLESGHAALLARSGVARLEMEADGAAVIVTFNRAKLQIAATARLGEPQQLRVCNVPLRLTPPLVAKIRAAARASQEDFDSWDEAFVGELIDAFRAAPDATRPMRCADALVLAMRVIAAEAGTPLESDAIAEAAGLSLRSLRAAFRDILGLSLADYVQRRRIERLRALLSSGYETRSIREVAKALGFASPLVLSRIYLHIFGETPIETRARKANDRRVV